MARVKAARDGTTLRINDVDVKFSLWPTRTRKMSRVLQFEVLTQNPWDIIEHEINTKYQKNAAKRDTCLSFLSQSKDFYIASQNQFLASRPLLLYYSFLNLAKAFIIFSELSDHLDRAGHGIFEVPLKAAEKEFQDARVTVKPDAANKRLVFDLFGQALRCPHLVADQSFHIVDHVVPQIVIGHRLWAVAAAAPERFIRCEEIEFKQSYPQKEIWAALRVKRSDLKAASLSHSEFTKRADISADFEEVTTDDEADNKFVVLQSKNPRRYARRPGDDLHKVVESLQQKIWTVVRTIPPYRRWYLYAAPLNCPRLHPLLSVYAMIFYLGSVTRYRPHHFAIIKQSRYGMLVDEIISTQGQQFLYQMATEFAKRDVSMPAVVS